MKEEFNYLNASFNDRYERLEEYVKIMRALWSGKDEFKGKFYSFSNAHFNPKPIKEIPIWLGGNSSKVIESVARFGNGWQPIGLSLNDFSKKVRRLKRISRRDITVSLRMNVKIGEEVENVVKLPSGKIRFRLVGKVSSIIEQISRYKENGLEYLLCYFEDIPIDNTLKQMRIFAKDIIPSLPEKSK
jgi:alkanesulfonate monooxygenase SsuD/methylene tetrahydromethanopterin reductase-like flavin-dependent oxidoreductase (luciferase family)